VADESAPAGTAAAKRSPILLIRRGLLLIALAIAAWSMTRAALLLSGNDQVVADSDPHGYFAIFSLVLLPVLAVAVATVVSDTAELWRRGRSGRSCHVSPGLTLALSAPLAGPFALAAVIIGVAVVVAALADRYYAPRTKDG
jgi:hypothetical protein